LHLQDKISALKHRASVLASIRLFFNQKGVFEVETPLMCSAPVTDPFLEALQVFYKDKRWYLQTSPEYAMKRLLCEGSGSIYQICKAFRADEQGRLHQPEFTLLEWYRLDFDHHDLMQEMDEFLQYVIHTAPAVKYSYQEIFEKYLHINPHTTSDKDLKCVLEKNITLDHAALERDDYLHLLMTHLIEPQLDKTHPVFIYDFPPSQAALAKIRNDDPPVGERFEVYVEGIELANGYHELTKVNEQKKRFEQDIIKRKKLGYPVVPIDHYLLSAMEKGLPDCAGVALGIDRLIMIAARKQSLDEVMAFTQACI
jgi:lysyl-tRNA synthetase class 2